MWSMEVGLSPGGLNSNLIPGRTNVKNGGQDHSDIPRTHCLGTGREDPPKYLLDDFDGKHAERDLGVVNFPGHAADIRILDC